MMIATYTPTLTISKFPHVALLVLLCITNTATGKLFVTSPVNSSTCTGGQSCTVEWVDDGTAPLLNTVGPCNIGLYYNDDNTHETIFAQAIASGFDVDSAHSITFTPDPAAGPNLDTYFVEFISTAMTFEAFSAAFTLNDMTGTSGSSVPSDTSVISTSTSSSSSSSGSQSSISSSTTPSSSSSASSSGSASSASTSSPSSGITAISTVTVTSSGSSSTSPSSSSSESISSFSSSSIAGGFSSGSGSSSSSTGPLAGNASSTTTSTSRTTLVVGLPTSSTPTSTQTVIAPPPTQTLNSAAISQFTSIIDHSVLGAMVSMLLVIASCYIL